jgi:hypothetical protein
MANFLAWKYVSLAGLAGFLDTAGGEVEREVLLGGMAEREEVGGERGGEGGGEGGLEIAGRTSPERLTNL